MFDNLKQEIYNNINLSKKIMKDDEIVKSRLKNSLPRLEKFLNDYENYKDENPDLVRESFLDNNILKILSDETHDYINNLYDEKGKDEVTFQTLKIKSAFDSEESIENRTKVIAEIAYNIYEFAKKRYENLQIDIARNLRNVSKTVLSIIEKREYKKDKDAINMVIKYIKNETDITEEELENITFYMTDEFKKEEKRQLELEFKRQLEKERLEQEKANSVILEEPVEEKEKVVKHNILSEEERVIIDEINNIVLSKKDDIKYLNEEFINQLKKDEEIYEEYKSDVLVYKLNELVKKIFAIQNRINNKEDLTDIQLNKYMFLKDKIMLKIKTVYLEYNKLNVTNSVVEIEDNDKKTLIYLTNENDNLYFDINDFAKEQLPSISIIIDELEKGIIHNDYIKDCVYTDDKLKGIFRKRRGDIRTLYLPYKDYVFVITMFFKNTNQTKKIREYMNNVVSKTRNQIKQIKEDLNDEIKREEIINKNNLITENIKSSLTSKTKQKTIK